MPIFGLLSLFMLANILNKDIRFVLFSGLIYISSWYFVQQSMWNFSLRGFFFAEVPFLLFLCYKSIGEMGLKQKYYNSIFLIIWVIVMYSTHGMVAYGLMVLVLPVLFAKLIGKRTGFLEYLNNKTLRKAIFFLSLISFVFIILEVEYLRSIGVEILRISDESISRYSSFGKFGQLLSVVSMYLDKQLLSCFMIFGIFYFLQKSTLSKYEKYFFVSLPLLSFFALDFQYFYPVVLPSIAILASYGIIFIHEKSKENRFIYSSLLLTILIISSSFFAVLIKAKNTDNPEKQFKMDEVDVREFGFPGEGYNTVFWSNQYIITDEKNRMLGFGHFSYSLSYYQQTHSLDFASLALDDEFIAATTIHRANLRDILLFQAPHQYGGGVEYPFSEKEDNPAGYFQILVEVETFKGSLIIERYNVHYFVDTEKTDYSKPAFNEIRGGNFKLYDNEISSIYYF
jgi:hypothetical protein